MITLEGDGGERDLEDDLDFSLEAVPLKGGVDPGPGSGEQNLEKSAHMTDEALHRKSHTSDRTNSTTVVNFEKKYARKTVRACGSKQAVLTERC